MRYRKAFRPASAMWRSREISPHLLMDISGYAVEDNLSDYLMELNAVKAGSFLEELDDTSL